MPKWHPNFYVQLTSLFRYVNVLDYIFISFCDVNDVYCVALLNTWLATYIQSLRDYHKL